MHTIKSKLESAYHCPYFATVFVGLALAAVVRVDPTFMGGTTVVVTGLAGGATAVETGGAGAGAAGAPEPTTAGP